MDMDMLAAPYLSISGALQTPTADACALGVRWLSDCPRIFANTCRIRLSQRRGGYLSLDGALVARDVGFDAG